MLHNHRVFRYRIITNFHCNQNCYFCFQPEKREKILDIEKMEDTMKKVGMLERATIMGGESLLLPNIVDYFKVVHKYVNTICLVTNGTKLTEDLTKALVENGLEEMAISISSKEQYKARREQILIAKKYVPNLRINLPKSWESTGKKLYELVDMILKDDIGVVVCEDLMGRYNLNYKNSYEDLLYGITDTHCHMRKEQIEDFLSDIEDKIDIVFILGDMSERDMFVAKEIAKKYKALIYGILGNHDYDGQLEEMDIPNFEGKMIEFNGVTFTGMHGSFKYKNSDAPMLTNEESIELAKILPTCDIFLTHDKARTNNEENSHSGLEGITQYILDKKPEYHIHGHLHENMNENIGGISSLGFCRYAYIEVSKNGLKIKKIF